MSFTKRVLGFLIDNPGWHTAHGVSHGLGMGNAGRATVARELSYYATTKVTQRRGTRGKFEYSAP